MYNQKWYSDINNSSRLELYSIYNIILNPRNTSERRHTSYELKLEDTTIHHANKGFAILVI